MPDLDQIKQVKQGARYGDVYYRGAEGLGEADFVIVTTPETLSIGTAKA
jgi:hypothetical protein